MVTHTHKGLSHGLLRGERAQGAVLDGLLSNAFTAISVKLLIIDGAIVWDMFQKAQDFLL